MIRVFNDHLPKLPDVFTTDNGLIPHVNRDKQDRIIRAYGRISGHNPEEPGVEGPGLYPNLHSNTENGENCCYILPTTLGGNNNNDDNAVYLQDPYLNSFEAVFEKLQDQWLNNENHFIQFELFFSYPDDKTKLASQCLVSIDSCYIDKEGKDKVKASHREGDPAQFSSLTEKLYNEDEKNKASKSHLLKSAVYVGSAVNNIVSATGNAAKTAGQASWITVNGASIAIISGKMLVSSKRIFLPAALAVDGYRIGSAVVSGDEKDVVKTTAKVGGEWSGLWVGATTGAAAGSAFLPFGGTLVGGVIGGIAGAFTGGWTGEKIAEAFVDDEPNIE